MSINVRSLTLIGSLSILASILGSCSGGLIGTASGPGGSGSTKPVVKLRALPSRISPTIPDTFANLDDRIAGSSSSNSSESSDTAQSWKKLSPAMNQVGDTTLNVQEALILLDSVLDEIDTSCLFQSGGCLFASESIQVQYTPLIMDQLKALYSYEEQALDSELGRALRDKALTWFVFGEIMYTRLQGSEFDNQLSIIDLQLINNRTLTLRWSDDRSKVDYSLSSDLPDSNAEFYQYHLGEQQESLRIYAHPNAMSLGEAYKLELTALHDTSTPLHFDAYYSGQIISGHANDDFAIASTVSFASHEDTVHEFEEAFSGTGEIVEVGDCFVDWKTDICELTLFASDLEATVTTSYMGNDRLPVNVRNLPDNILSFEIWKKTNFYAGESEAWICHGFHYPEVFPSRNDFDIQAEVFCLQELPEVSELVVIGYDQYGLGRPIPEAVISYQ